MTTPDLSLDMPPAALTVRAAPWGTVASLLFHAGLAAAVVLLSPVILEPPPPPVITVDILTEAQFQAALQPAPPPSPLASEAAVAPTEGRLTPSQPLEPDIPPNPTFTATQFYSANILRELENTDVVRTLRSFTDQERIIQVCNLEAIEQIARAAPDYEPDTVVGYAMSDFVLDGLSIIAAGGAFRSRRRWYEVSYTCTAAPGYEAVTAFEFKLGSEIPDRLWEAHNLNASDEDGD